MSILKKYALLFLVPVLLLAGCAKDNTPPPMALSKVAPHELKTRVMWHAETGDGAGEQGLTLSPAVNGHYLVAVGYKGYITALNRLSGQRLWQLRLHAHPSATPTISGHTVYVGTMGGRIFAINLLNGHVVWHAQASSSVLAAVAVRNNTVVAHTNDDGVTAFDALTGKQLWHRNGTSPRLQLMASSAPVIAGGLVIVGTNTGDLMALDLQNGQLQWSRPVALPTGSSTVAQMVVVSGAPVVANDVIYAVSYHGNLVAVNLQNGHLIWQHPVSSYESVAVGSGRVFVTNDQGMVMAFDEETGRELWQQHRLLHRFVSAPVVVVNYVVVGDYQGYVHWLSVQDGRLLARNQIASSCVRGAGIADKGIVYFVSNSGKLAALQDQSST